MSHSNDFQRGGSGRTQSPTRTISAAQSRHQARRFDHGSTSSSSSGGTLSNYPNPSSQIDIELLESGGTFKPPTSRASRISWSPSPLTRQAALVDETYDMPTRFSQDGCGLEQHSAVPIPQNFMRSFSPSNDSVHTSGSFTRSAAPIALFADDTDYSDTDGEAGPSTARYGPMQSSVLPQRPLSDALGLGFNDADLDLSFEDSPIAERNIRRAALTQRGASGEPRSPSLRHVGRLPRRELGAGSGSEAGSIIGLSSPENSPQRLQQSRFSPQSQSSPLQSMSLQVNDAGETFYTPRVGGKATLMPDQITTFAAGPLSERTPSADQKRTPRSVSTSAVVTTNTAPPIPPLPLLKPKTSLSTGSVPMVEPLSLFRSPSSRPTLLLHTNRASESPRSPDSAPTDAPTPSAEDYDAGESGFSNVTGQSSSLFGSSSVLVSGRNSSVSTNASSSTNSPDLRPGRTNSSLVPVYSDMESEGEGFPGLVGLRQASTVSERWDEDFLFQEETGDDEPQSSGTTRRKGRRKERHKERVRTASVPLDDRSHRTRSVRQAGSRGESTSGSAGLKPLAQSKLSSADGEGIASRQRESRSTKPPIDDGDDFDGSDGSSSDDEDDGGDDTMQEGGRDRFLDDDDDDEEENWDGEISMLSGSSVNMSTTTGKMTASSSARTIMPATPSNLLMTGTSARVPSGHSERTPTGLGSRRVTPKASKKSSVPRLQPPPMPIGSDISRKARDGRTLKPPRAGDDDGTASGASSQDHEGNGRVGLSSSVNSHQASTSSRSSGTIAHQRASIMSSSTDGRGSGYADSLHKKAAGSISASTDFSARLAAQSEISSWHGHGRRSNSISERLNPRDEVDLAHVEIREDPVARQPITAIDAETRAQTRERARAWVEENSRDPSLGVADLHARKPSGKRKQPALFPTQRGNGSAAEDTETEDRYPSPRSLHAETSRNGAQGPVNGSKAPPELFGSSDTVITRSPTQTSLANLLSFGGKKIKEVSASPKDSSPLSRRIRTNSRVQKLVADQGDSRPPSRAGSTSSRSPETQRDRIKKLLVQQHKQRKGKLHKPGSSAGDQSPKTEPGSPEIELTRRRTRSQNGRSKLALSHGSPSADSNMASLRPPPQSPSRASSPFGRSWDVIRSATANGRQKVAAEGGDAEKQAPNRDEGLPTSTSAGALNAVRSDAGSPAPGPAPAEPRPKHGRTGSSLSISFGISKPFSSLNGGKGKGVEAPSASPQQIQRSQDVQNTRGGVSGTAPDSSREDSPSSSPSDRIFRRKNNPAPPQRNLPSALMGAQNGGTGAYDSRSASNSTAVTNSSSLASSDFWARQGEARDGAKGTSSRTGRRRPSGGSSNATTPTLGSPESPRIKAGSTLGPAVPLSQSRRPSGSKAPTASGRRSRRPSTSPEIPHSELMGEPSSSLPPNDVQHEAKNRQASSGSSSSRKGLAARPSGVSALKSSPEDPAPPVSASQLAANADSSSSKMVLRRNSLSDLRIPTRISRAQDGIRANMTYLRDFARGITELKALQARYHAALLELHRHQEGGQLMDGEMEELLRKLDDVELSYAPWWECADVLIGLGDGRGEADRSASLETLTHSPAPVNNRNRRITLNTPPRPMQAGYVPMTKELSSDATSSLTSDTSSSMSVRRTDTASAVSRASSMSGRQVAAQREMDILSLMLAGAPLDSSFANQSREGGSKGSAQFQSVVEDVAVGADSGQNSTSGHSTSSLTFAEPSPMKPKDVPSKPGARDGPYKPYGIAANSTTSIAATSTDSFAHLQSLDPDKSGRRKLRNASRAGLQGLRELLRSFKLSSNNETDSSANLGADSAASTPADESVPAQLTHAHTSTSFLDGRTSQSKQYLAGQERPSRPSSAMGPEPSPSRRRSKIFSLVSAGLSSSRLDVLPIRPRVISTASSSAQSSSHADILDNSADSGWTQSEIDHMEAMRASSDSIRTNIGSPAPPSSGSGQLTPSGGTRHRLFSLGRQLIGSRPRGDSFTSKQSISPANLSIPLPPVEDEAVSAGGDSGFSMASSYTSERAPSRAESAMGPPDTSDQLTLGRKHGDRIHMGLTGTETVRRPAGLAVSGEPRRPSGGLRAGETNRPNMINRPPAFGRSFSASPSPAPSPSTSLQQIPAVPPLPSPLVLEGMVARTRDHGSSATTGSSLGGESWGSLGSDSDRGAVSTATTSASTSRIGERGVTSANFKEGSSSAASMTLSRPTTVSDAAAMSRFRKLILRPDAIRSLLAYVQATKNHCDTALIEVSRLAEAMEGMKLADGGAGRKWTPAVVGTGTGSMMASSSSSAPSSAHAQGFAHRLDEADEEEKEMMMGGTIRSPSATTPKRASLQPPPQAITSAASTIASR
ncbi:hypothetical protein OC835_003093 [Tilletia horrida]|nr:hypothetical protein OC835_003093 [Tilletia horrida]